MNVSMESTMLASWVFEHSIKHKMYSVREECIANHDIVLQRLPIHAAVAHLDMIVKSPAMLDDTSQLVNAMQLLEQVYNEIPVKSKLIVCLVTSLKTVICMKHLEANILKPKDIKAYFYEDNRRSLLLMKETFSITDNQNLDLVMNTNSRLRSFFTRMLDDAEYNEKYKKRLSEDLRRCSVKFSGHLTTFVKTVVTKLPSTKIDKFVANPSHEVSKEISEEERSLLERELDGTVTEEKLLKILEMMETLNT